MIGALRKMELLVVGLASGIVTYLYTTDLDVKEKVDDAGKSIKAAAKSIIDNVAEFGKETLDAAEQMTSQESKSQWTYDDKWNSVL